MNDQIYTASVYVKTVKYTNFKNKTQETELFFALDPLQLLQVISSFEIKKKKSGDPRKQGQIEELSAEDQVKFIRNVTKAAAGFPSDDGESWEPFEDFENTIAGKAFLTQMTASDGDRKDFTEKVVLDPFRAFVGYAQSDPSNSKTEIDNLVRMLGQLEKVFAEPAPENESLEDRRARLRRELSEIQDGGETSES